MKNNAIDMTSLILQMYSLIFIMQDFNNTDLMQELQRQDKEYLEKIIEQNKEIITLLKERSDKNGRESYKTNG